MNREWIADAPAAGQALREIVERAGDQAARVAGAPVAHAVEFLVRPALAEEFIETPQRRIGQCSLAAPSGRDRFRRESIPDFIAR